MNFQTYISVLKSELIPAQGCTEPIAVAYAAAKAREVLGCLPTDAAVAVCGNILKNVKSVIVPNTDGLKGIEAAAAAGIAAGDAGKALLVIADILPEQHADIRNFISTVPIKVTVLNSEKQLDISVTVCSGSQSASVRISDSHTHIAEIVHNGKVVFSDNANDAPSNALESCELSLQSIFEFARDVPVEMLKPVLDPQIKLNSAIAEEGLKGDYGSQVGKLVLRQEQGAEAQAIAYPAAGSDARMNGCEMPVVIVAGSGNQGMTASLPVIRWARFSGADAELLYRALALSDLVTIYQKSFIGKLSAFCGAVSAGCGAAAGIAYLETQNFEAVRMTVNNALAITSGMICDGAKSSCAAKIATSVRAAIMGYRLYRNGLSFPTNDGILSDDTDETVQRVGEIAKDGMRSTDRTIIKIMCNV